MNWGASDSINAVAQSNFSLLYHLLNTKHATADHRANLNRISNKLAEYNVTLVSMGILTQCAWEKYYYTLGMNIIHLERVLIYTEYIDCSCI